MTPAPRHGRLSPAALALAVVVLLAVTTIVQVLLFEHDRIFIYLVLAFDLSVVLVALLLADMRVFFWFNGVAVGFVATTLLVVAALAAEHMQVQMQVGLATSSFFGLMGFVVGILAQSVDLLHRRIHDAASEKE